MAARTSHSHRIGLIGCGRISTLRHLPALRRLSEARVVALADIDGAALARVGTEYGVERLHLSAEALIEDPEVDCVGVMVPVIDHAAVSTAALEAGKHVLVEKPLALTVEDCDRMVEAAGRSDAVAMIGHNLRFHRLVRRAGELIATGAVGEPETIRTVTAGGADDDPVDGIPAPAWKSDGAVGGGAIMEKGVHHYDLWRFLTEAEPVRVSALAEAEGSYDRPASVSASLSSGAVAQGSLAFGHPATNEISVAGSEGRIDLDLYAFDGLRLRGLADISGSPRTRARTAFAAARALPRGIGELIGGGAYVRSYAEEWRHFLACVRGEARLASTLADGRESARVAIAAVRSAREGVTIELSAASMPEPPQRV